MAAPKPRTTALANAASSIASAWAAVPNAYAVLARACAMNAHRRRFTAVANGAKSTTSD